MKKRASIVLGVFLLAGARSLSAQQVNPRVPPPPPPAETPAAPAQPAVPSSDGKPPVTQTPATQPAVAKPIDPSIPPPPPSADSDDAPTAPSGPVFDPLHAQRSLDVGTFYFRKGSYDAAIDRFVEASNYQPGLAMPWRMLGDTYEKKREYAKAVGAYNKYLQISPRASDTAKVRKLVADLEEKIAQESTKKAER